MASPLLPGGILPPGEPTIDIAQNLAENPRTYLFASPSETKPIDKGAVAKLNARRAAQPEPGFEGLQEVASNTTAEPGFEGLQEVDPGFEHLKEADKLDYSSPEELKNDSSFQPAQYVAENPNVSHDAEKFKKLLDVYRARREEGLSFGKVAKAAVTEAPGIVGKTLKGAKQLAERAIDIGVQPAANVLLGAVTGTTPEEQAGIQAETGKQQLKGAAEITAGTEQAITGISQLAQQGGRKLFGKPVKELTDSELENQLREDAEFHKALNATAGGTGEASQLLGLDADTLQKNGVELDKDAIQNLSLVDPVTLVATAGIFKVVGAGGKILATAATRAGADAVLQGIQKVAAKSIQVAGKGVELAGRGVQKFPLRTASAVGVGGQLAAGNIPGAITSAVAPLAIKQGGRALEAAGKVIGEAGQALEPGFVGPKSAALTRIAEIASSPVGQVATGAAKGAVQGGVVAAPLAAAAQENETAGAILGGGTALGAIAGGVGAAKETVANSVAKRYLDPHSIPFEQTNSPGYGIDANLDATHEAAIKSLPQNDQNAVNAFREAIRNQGGEIYVQDPQSYKARILDSMEAENGGQPLTPEQISKAETYANTHAFFDGYLTDANGQQRRAIFLNNSAKGLPHDAGHLFQAMLSPERQAELRQSVLDSYSPEQLTEFAKGYANRLGDAEIFSKLGETASKNKIADEIIAENFSQLFSNTKLSDLKAPQGVLEKLGRIAVEAGEALGIDLTAGRTTPDLQANPSYRLQGILRNAAKEVLNLPEAPKPEPFRTQGELELKPAEQPKVAPTAEELAKPTSPETPVSPPSEKPVSSEPDAAAKRAQETGVEQARELSKDNPDALATVNTVAASMESGNPALKIEHRGITTEAEAPREAGRTQRRSEQARGYEELKRLQIENRKEAPESVVNTHEKTFVPVRFVEQGGKATLIAMSLDKVIANIRRVIADAAGKADDIIPYEIKDGKLTDSGWNQALADLQTYAENQANGYRGDGQTLLRPGAGDEGKLSLPAENPNYTPKPLSEPVADFQNLIQGIAPPKTARQIKGQTPGNVKGQILAEINQRKTAPPSVISAGDISKQSFKKPFEGRTVQETNPLRNQLAERGVKVRELSEVTERLAAEDIDVGGKAAEQFKAPVTDVIRGGFLPAEPVEKINAVQNLGPEDWRKFIDSVPNRSLAAEAYRTGFSLTDKAQLELLKRAQEEALAKSSRLMAEAKAGNFDVMDEAFAEASKGQFFREAYEAATDTGSAAGESGWRRQVPEGKPPFAEAGKAEKAFGKGEMERLFLPAEQIPDELDPVKMAAIRTKSGNIITGAWHGEAYMNLAEKIASGEIHETLPEGMKSLTELLDSVIETGGPSGFVEDGFVTKSGKFLNRAEALEHAEKINQLRAAPKGEFTQRGGARGAGVLESTEFNRDRSFLPSDKEITDALSADKRPFVGAARELKPGTAIGVRIDIPAFNRTGTYVQTVHEKASGGQVGKRIGYDSVVTVDNPTFFSNERGAEKIKGGAAKFPIATVEGEFNPSREVPTDLEGWTEVRFNPTKHSYFYDKATDEPVTGGTQAVSVGNSVFVKDATFGGKKDYLFLPKPGTPEYNDYVANRIEESKKFPEAIPLDANKDKSGNYKSEYKDEPNWVREPWAFNETPLAKENRVEGDTVASENKYTDALAKELETAYHEAKKNPAVEEGEKWYSVAREKLQTLLGDDAQFFAELLGATSPNTAVDVNFGYALEAYNLFKQGFYDKILEKYREGRAKFEAGELDEFTKETGKTGKKATEKAFLSWWADKHDLQPTSNRQKPDGSYIKFGMHTEPVMRVLDRSWLQQVEGPKTPNFTGNLSGASFEATIDKWAARLVHRLSSEGRTGDKPWRILPPAETGVSDRDFFTAQKAFRKAGDALGVSPDALQAILWFFEKEHWEKNGWTTTTGAAKADYNVLLQRTTKTPEGKLTYEKITKAKAPKKPKVAAEDVQQPVDTTVSASDIE